MKTIRLYAEPECWEFRDAYPDDWKYFGCGPGDIGDYLVPDNILGVSVREACRVHDWYYRFFEGNTEEDRRMADRIFFNNMTKIIRGAGGRWLLVRLRCRIALVYYRSVVTYGANSFWESRNKPETLRRIS